MLCKHSDRNLVEGIKKGDDNSINYLYESFFDTVKNHILSNTGTEDDAYDIFQDTMMVLFKKIQLNNFELKGDLKGYIFGISRNLWYEQLRKRKINVEIESNMPDDIDIEKLLDIPIEQIVQRSFLKLKPECQKVLSLHMQGSDYASIAKEMGYKSEAYARRKKYLCKEALIKIMKTDPDFKDYTDFDL